VATVNPSTTLSFTVNRLGDYALLQLENVLLSSGAQTGGGGAAQQLAPLPPPPLNEDMVGTPSTATTPKVISLSRLRTWFDELTRKMNQNASFVDALQPAPLDELIQSISAGSQTASGVGQAGSTPRAAWRGWFLQLVNRLNTLIPSTGSNGNASAQVNFEAPSLDEMDIGWYALAGAIGVNDPVTISPTIISTSRYSRQFAVGDFVIWNDPKVAGNQYGYEIMQITAMDGGQWTLARHSPGAAPNVSWFGTPTVPHAAGLKVYRLIDKQWNVTIPFADPQVLKLPWDNMDVIAVVGTPAGGNSVLINLTPTPPAVPTPGFRTLSGSEYLVTMSGALTTGQVADYRVQISDWHSLRQLLGRLNTNPTGASPTVIALVYIAPNSQQAALVTTLTIAPHSRLTYQQVATGSRFPFDIGAWPPHVWEDLAQPFDATGKLQLPLMPGVSSLTLTEDGWWDLIVTDGSGGGSDFILAVQS
jgi:hypothetical protein